jgi:hypothetical protein
MHPKKVYKTDYLIIQDGSTRRMPVQIQKRQTKNVMKAIKIVLAIQISG